jgi:rubrerythrin
MDIRKIYEYALQREREGKRFFEENAARLSSAAAVDAFRTLAVEEQKHIDFILEQINALDRGEDSSILLETRMDEASFFSQRARSEMIEHTVHEAMVADLPVLRMAYLIERDFAEFYEMAAQKTSGDAKHVLQMLASWERGHERLFKFMHDQAFERYAEMPWGG